MSGSLNSPLTLAYLGQGMGGQQQDPLIAAAMPRLQLAQALMQSGTSDAPTSGWGALSRMAQAMVGNYAFNNANEGIQNALAQRSKDAVNAMGYMRGGPNPMQQPQGMPGSAPMAPSPQGAPGSAPMAPSPNGNANFETKLINVESSGNPAAVNKQGFSGLAQFGAARLADPAMGFYKPSPGENLAANQWTGSFNIPGFPDVKTQADFLKNPAAQQAVLRAHVMDIDRAIGATPGADKYDQNGLRAVAHLGGIAGMKKFVATGGQTNPADSYGISLKNYYDRFNSGAQPVAAQQGQPQQSQPQQGQPQTGQNAPMVSQGLDMMRRAQEMAVANPYNPAIQHAAQMQIQYAQTLMGLDQYAAGPNGTQTNLRTGKQENAAVPTANYQQTSRGTYTAPGHEPKFAPSPRTVTDAHGNVLSVGAGGQVETVAPNPSGIGGNSNENEVMRTMIELGPKVLQNTATPEERAKYNLAATTYQGYKTAIDPVTKLPTQVTERPIPPGSPVPGEAPGAPAGPPPTQAAPGSPPLPPGMAAPPGQPAAQPPAPPDALGRVRGAEVRQSAADAEIKKTQGDITEEQQKILSGSNMLGTTQTIRATLPQVKTGTLAESRLAAAKVFQTLGVSPETAQSWLGTSAAPGEILQKKLFELSTGAVRGMGAREPGSVMQMFQKNYPNLSSQNMTIDAMTRLLDMDQLYKEHEIEARSSHIRGQVANVGTEAGYQGLKGYVRPDPRVYQAAALASGGMPHSIWTSGLTDAQQTQALKLASSIYPDASALDQRGVVHRFQSQGGGGG